MSNSRETEQENSYRKKIRESDLDFTEEIFKRGVIEGTKHATPSRETINRFEKLDHCLQDLTDAIHRLEEHSKVRSKKVDEMYEYFIKGGNVVWFIKWVFGSAAALGGLIIMAKSILDGK